MTGMRTTLECPGCHGDGWYVDHEDACYEDGDCNCSGVQVGCEMCHGTGGVAVRPLSDVVADLEEQGL